MHKVVYQYLDNMFKNVKPNKQINPHNPDAYRIDLGKYVSYFYFGPGEDDGGDIHYGVGTLHIHPDIVDELRRLIKIRETNVVDIIADWFSEKFDIDVDNISIYPNRKTPAAY
jgi:hypothetical protein